MVRWQGALPAAAGLRHAINGLDDAADARLAVRSGGFVARWWVTINDFAGLKFALKRCERA
eukprot:5179422-Pleurochrysis_carterae.AAC.1